MNVQLLFKIFACTCIDSFHGRPLFPVKLTAGNFGTYIYIRQLTDQYFQHGPLFPVISVRADQNSKEILVRPDPNFQAKIPVTGLLRCMLFRPPHEAKGNDKWAPVLVRRLVNGFNDRRLQKIYPGWQLCIDESISSRRGNPEMPHIHWRSYTKKFQIEFFNFLTYSGIF